MVSKSGCFLCGAELVYADSAADIACDVCQTKSRSNASCRQGHFVCDRCHEADAFDFIETYCLNTAGADPVETAIAIMRHPRVAMHGPEHHFLVPAALAAACARAGGEEGLLPGRLRTIKERAGNVLDGFCAFYGACGAAVGAGIFTSVMLSATPLSQREWRFANLMTATSLEKIAEAGGPRCCKRDSFLALETAVKFLKAHFDIDLPVHRPACPFHELNRECTKEGCRYYSG